MHILLPTLLFIGITGIGGLFTLKIVELRQRVTFGSTWRKKYDDRLLHVLLRGVKEFESMSNNIRVPDGVPHIIGVLRNVSTVGFRLMENRPIRMTGPVYGAGEQTTTRVSRFLREVSKSKERDTVAEHEQRIES